jgi:TRAP-type uncharacterized transport system fused permease subunit
MMQPLVDESHSVMPAPPPTAKGMARYAYRFIALIALLWAVAVLLLAAATYLPPLPLSRQWIGLNPTNDMHWLLLHLCFAMCLTLLLYPTRHPATPRRPVPFTGITMALLTVLATGYALLHPGFLSAGFQQQNPIDQMVVALSLLLFLVAVRRAGGMPLAMLCALMLFYSLFSGYAEEETGLGFATREQTAPLDTIRTLVFLFIQQLFPYILLFALLDRAGLWTALQRAITLQRADTLSDGEEKAQRQMLQLLARLFPPIMGGGIALLILYHTGLDASRFFSLAVPAAIICLLAFMALLHFDKVARREPSLTRAEIKDRLGRAVSGVYAVLPLLAALAALLYYQLSLEKAGWLGCGLALLILLPRHLLAASFRRRPLHWYQALHGLRDALAGLARGAMEMARLLMIAAGAGLVLALLQFNGLDTYLPTLIIQLSQNVLVALLMMVAVLALAAGWLIPAPGSYLILQGLVVAIMLESAAINGFVMPVVVLHLFLAYATLIGEAMRQSGIWRYGLFTLVMPFVIFFEPLVTFTQQADILNQLSTILAVTLAFILLAAVLRGAWIVRNNRAETLVLFLVFITLLNPSLWMDRIYPPYKPIPPQELEEIAGVMPADAELKLEILGHNEHNQVERISTVLPLGQPHKTGHARLSEQGLILRQEEGRVVVAKTDFMSPAETAGLYTDDEIIAVGIPQFQPNVNWVMLPALLLLLVISWQQWRRQQKQLRV